VGVDADELVRGDKGPSRPIVPDFQRVIMVDALKPVAFSFIMSSVQDFGKAASIFQPDIIFKNEEFEGCEHTIVGREYAKQIMIIRDQISHHSTTDIIRRVSKSASD
jgi:bifunctional ADP-heptose synthase (sugar kinase/adenylyltransferase)